MSLPKIDEVRTLSDEDIAAQVVETKKQLFELRMQKAIGQFEGPHQFKHLKHRLAQLLTVESQRQAQVAATAEPAPSAEAAPEPTAESAEPAES
ncbi:MAG: 50S ribosomal protein L29 [Geitlerinemataceae cyanobacterium]